MIRLESALHEWFFGGLLCLVLAYIVVHLGNVFHPRNQNWTTVFILGTGIPVALIIVFGVIGWIA